MKKYFIIMFLLSCKIIFAQDIVVMRDSTRMNVKVVESNEKNIIFTYPNEDIRNEKSKKIIAYIIYASGRREECKPAIVIPTISGKKDWEKVVITRDKEDVNGLTKVKNISSISGSVFVSREKAYDDTLDKLKKKTAKIGCGIVLIVNEKPAGMGDIGYLIIGEAYK